MNKLCSVARLPSGATLATARVEQNIEERSVHLRQLLDDGIAPTFPTSDRENSYELDAFVTERVPYAAARIATEAMLSVDASMHEHCLSRSTRPIVIVLIAATTGGPPMMANIGRLKPSAIPVGGHRADN